MKSSVLQSILRMSRFSVFSGLILLLSLILCGWNQTVSTIYISYLCTVSCWE